MANCDNETSVELLMCLCFCRGGQQWVPAYGSFVEDVDKLFDSFNSVKRGAAGKPLRSPLSDNSPHVWLEIKWLYFQLASVLFRFELQQVISAIVYM